MMERIMIPKEVESKTLEIGGEILKLASQIIDGLQNGFKSLKLAKKFRNGQKTGIQDITTELDHKIGKLFIERVYKKFASYLTVDSEEVEERVGTGPIILRFDPLDGSKHFVEGFPQIASAATLVYEEEVQFGMIIEPFIDSVYHAVKEKGAYLNSKKISVNNKSLSDDLSFVMYEAPNTKLYAKDSEKFDTFSKHLSSLQKTAFRMRNIGLATLSICYVADGSCPLYVDLSTSTKLYDVEAAVLIAQEAGAVVGTTTGEIITKLEYNKTSDKKEVTGNLLIGNPKAWREAVKILND